MATFKGIIFANRAAFDGAITGKLNQYKAKTKDNYNLTTILANGIDSLDDDKVLLPINNRYIKQLDWNPNQIDDIDTNDPKWFNLNDFI